MPFLDPKNIRKRSSRKMDADLKAMTPARLRREIMRLRRVLRKHRDADENARCWHNDLALYAVLPEGKPPGKMTLPEAVLLKNCRRYIRRQQCQANACSGRG